MNHRKISKRKNVITQSRKKTLGNSKIGKGQSKNIRFYSKKKKRYSQKINQKGGGLSGADAIFTLNLGDKFTREPISFWEIIQPHLYNHDKKRDLSAETDFVEDDGIEIYPNLLYLKVSDKLMNDTDFYKDETGKKSLEYIEKNKGFVEFLGKHVTDQKSILLKIDEENYFCPGIKIRVREINKDNKVGIRQKSHPLTHYLAADNTCSCVQDGQDGNYILVIGEGDHIRMIRLPNIFSSDSNLKVVSDNTSGISTRYNLTIPKTHTRWKDSFLLSTKKKKIDNIFKFVHNEDGSDEHKIYWEINNVKIKSKPVNSFSKKDNSFLSHLIIEFTANREQFEIYFSVNSSDKNQSKNEPPIISDDGKKTPIITTEDIINSVKDFLFTYKTCYLAGGTSLIYPSVLFKKETQRDGGDNEHVFITFTDEDLEKVTNKYISTYKHVEEELSTDKVMRALKYSNFEDGEELPFIRYEEKKIILQGDYEHVKHVSVSIPFFKTIQYYLDEMINPQNVQHLSNLELNIDDVNLTQTEYKTNSERTYGTGMWSRFKSGLSNLKQLFGGFLGGWFHHIKTGNSIDKKTEEDNLGLNEYELSQFEKEYEGEEFRLVWTKDSLFSVLRKISQFEKKPTSSEETLTYTIPKLEPGKVMKDLAYFSMDGHRLTFVSSEEDSDNVTILLKTPYFKEEIKGLIIKEVVTEDYFGAERFIKEDDGEEGDLVFYSGTKNNCAARTFTSKKMGTFDEECKSIVIGLNKGERIGQIEKVCEGSNEELVIPWLKTDRKKREIENQQDMEFITVSTYDESYKDESEDYPEIIQSFENIYLAIRALTTGLIPLPILKFNPIYFFIAKMGPLSPIHFPRYLIQVGQKALFYWHDVKDNNHFKYFELETSIPTILTVNKFIETNDSEIKFTLTPQDIKYLNEKFKVTKEELDIQIYTDLDTGRILGFTNQETNEGDKTTTITLEQKRTWGGYLGFKQSKLKTLCIKKRRKGPSKDLPGMSAEPEMSAEQYLKEEVSKFTNEYLERNFQPEFTVSSFLKPTYNLHKFSSKRYQKRIVVMTDTGLYWITGTTKSNFGFSIRDRLDIHYFQLFNGSNLGTYTTSELRTKTVSLKNSWSLFANPSAPTVKHFVQQMGWKLIKMPNNFPLGQEPFVLINEFEEMSEAPQTEIVGLVSPHDRDIIIKLINNQKDEEGSNYFGMIPDNSKFVQADKLIPALDLKTLAGFSTTSDNLTTSLHVRLSEKKKKKW